MIDAEYCKKHFGRKQDRLERRIDKWLEECVLPKFKVEDGVNPVEVAIPDWISCADLRENLGKRKFTTILVPGDIDNGYMAKGIEIDY